VNITLLEPYYTGSHRAWAAEYAARSRHRVDILNLAGRHWKWRMHGGAVTLARKFLAADRQPDLLLASDMLDLTTFLALTRQRTAHCKTAVYFHENQLTYPWSPTDADPAKQRDMHYAYINYTTALAADTVLFNSRYHQQAFLDELPSFLNAFPDNNEWATAQQIGRKSAVLPLGLDLRRLDPFRPEPQACASQRTPLILWNHRWEYDKNPEEFFKVLFQLADEGFLFEVAVLGESFGKQPRIYAEARERLGTKIVRWGYVEHFAEYAGWLWRADILPVTSRHDFFGGSVVQALYCGCTPLLPNRLAYPEHVPEQLHDEVFYNDRGELVSSLRRLLAATAEPVRNEGFRTFVARYDWKNLVPVYDDFFEGIAAGDRAEDLR
jgi:glycosyltransferase involved in cell wall biosynthesis